MNVKTGKILKSCKTRDGYLKVCLWKNNKNETPKIHRLVATAFLPNPENKPEVNHIDEDKTNNSVENLEWCNHDYNNNYGTRNKRIGEKMKNGKLSKPVMQYSLDGKFIKEFPSVMECSRNGFDCSAVCNCCNGKKTQYKGFIWKYKEVV